MRIAPAAAPPTPPTPTPVPPTPTPVPPTPAPPAFDAIFDFPTLHAGDRFKIASGSTANGLGIGGEARIVSMTATGAEVWIKAGKFGFSKEVSLVVQQSSPSGVAITVTEKGKTPVPAAGDIVAVRRNYSEFRANSPALTGAAILQLDAAGRFIVDVKGAAGGVLETDANLHLVLEMLAPTIGGPATWVRSAPPQREPLAVR